MILLSHPTGNSFVRAAAAGLSDAEMLFEFHTTIASFEGSLLDSVSSFRVFSELKRRRYDPQLKQKTKTWPWIEAGRHIALKTGISKFTQHETGIFSIDAVFQSLDKRVAARIKNSLPPEVNGVYAYEDGALFSFRQAKKNGIQCLYDLPIGYWKTARKMLEPERERWPEWVPTLTGFGDSAAKLERKDEELCLADQIFVASQFTASTLKDFQGNLSPVSVIPYGFPPVGPIKNYSPVSGHRPIKLLFVGGLSQRKGVADLFAAVKSFGDRVELTVVGHKPNNDCRALNNALADCKWIPSLPHEDILKIMREHDVLIFPSLFEGFGLVITEAMSQGTPVITTERTAGPDLIKHGENGWLINAGSTQALKDALEELLMKPGRIAEIGREAMETATRRPWDLYGKEIAAEIKQHKPANNKVSY
jgi:glycosyltransferase involved in cell wall biosynthesis